MSLFYRTLLNQLAQVSGSNVYDDTLSMAGAETAPDLSLQKDLNYIRTQLQKITGATDWYSAPASTIATINTDIGNLVHNGAISGSLSNIFTFTGMTNRNDPSPTYSSYVYTGGQTVNLETAIGGLDHNLGHRPSIGNMSGSLDNIWGFVGMTGDTSLVPAYSSATVVAQGSDLVVAIGALDAAMNFASVSKAIARLTAGVVSGSGGSQVPTEITVAGGLTYTRSNPGGKNMDVYLNGQLMQANTGTELRDYAEISTSTIAFTFNVPAHAYLSYLVRG